MAYVRLPLFQDSFFEYRTQLDGVAFRFEGEWSDRLGCIHLSVYDANDEPIIQGQALRPGSFFTYAPFGGPSGYFLVLGPSQSGKYTREDVRRGDITFNYATERDEA